jgi:hypothetical protein
LSKRPDTRYQTGEQFAADLRAVSGQLPKADAAPTPAPAPAGNASEKTVAFSATVPSRPAPPAARGGAMDIEI